MMQDNDIISSTGCYPIHCRQLILSLHFNDVNLFVYIVQLPQVCSGAVLTCVAAGDPYSWAGSLAHASFL